MKAQYAAAQPAREDGKPGQKHPWGAPRNVNTAQFFEITLALYAKEPAMRDEAIRIWGENHLGALTTKVGKLVHDCATAKDFSRLDPLCQFFRYRVARSGQGIPEITGGTGRCFADELRVYELQGLPLEDLWGMLLSVTSTHRLVSPKRASCFKLLGSCQTLRLLCGCCATAPASLKWCSQQELGLPVSITMLLWPSMLRCVIASCVSLVYAPMPTSGCRPL